jgi:hypothetical protein
MTTKLKVSFEHSTTRFNVEEVEIESETPTHVFIKNDNGNEVRFKKRTEHSSNYFNTWCEARDFMLEEVEVKKEQLLRIIKECQSMYDELNQMKVKYEKNEPHSSLPGPIAKPPAAPYDKGLT